MKTESYTQIILRSEDGKWLTQAVDTSNAERVIGTVVALGVNDSPENWKEITDAEAEALQAEIEAERKLCRDAVATGLQEGMS